MKKYILFIGIFLSPTMTRAQGQLGIKISPGISFNRVHTRPKDTGFSSAGAALRFKIGPIYDYSIKDNYCVSTGLLYSVQHVAIKNEKSSPSIREEHALHYLETPILLKLYTSELTLDIRLYVEIGLLVKIRVNAINTKLQKGQDDPFVEGFRRGGVAGLLGVGVQYETSLFTSIFAGISYHAGLSNVIDKQAQAPPSSTLLCYNDFLSIDLGVKF